MDEPTLQQVDLQQAREASLDRLQPPELPGYRLDRPLGEGTFGQVWSGVQLSTGQQVAIKVLHRLEAVHDLEREVERLRQVSQHPHVVSLLDANLHQRPPFLVLPLLQGSLSQQAGPSPHQVVTWLEQAATALQYVHARGVLHCDLKPANLLLDDNSGLRVADFGQALLQQSDRDQRLGTLFFMPPEQAQVGVPTLPSVSWDIYALGATFYQLLTGRPPRCHPAFQEQLSGCSGSREVLKLYADQLPLQPLIPLSVLRPDLDADLAALIEHCLHSQPERRYADMGSLLDDLRRRQNHLPLRCRGSSPTYVAARFVRRHRGAVAIAVMALGLLSGAVFQVVQQRAEAVRQAERAQKQSSRLAYLLAVQSEGSRAVEHIAESLQHEGSPDYRAVALGLYLQVLPRSLGSLSFRGDFFDLELAGRPDQGIVDLQRGELLAQGINDQRLARVDWHQPRPQWLEVGGELDQARLAAGQVAILDGEAVHWTVQDPGEAEADWIAQCPLGKTLVLGEDDDHRQLLRFLGAVQGQLSLPGPTPRSSQFSPDGAYLAVQQSGDRAHLLGLHPPRKLWAGVAERLAFTPDSHELLVAHRDSLGIIDASTGRLLQKRSFSGRPLALAASADSILVASSHEKGGRVWQFSRTAPEVLEQLDLAAYPLALWADSELLAIGCSDGSLRTYGAQLQVPGGVLHCTDQIRWLGRSGQELLAFTSSDDSLAGEFWRWQLPSVDSLTVAAGSELRLLEQGVLALQDGQFQWRSWADSRAGWVQPLTIRQPQVCGQELLALQGDQILRFDRSDGRILEQWPVPQGFQALRPDGKAALVCEADGRGWKEVSLPEGKLLRAHPNALQALERPQYSQDGKVAVAREGAEIVVLFSTPPRQLALFARDVWLTPNGDRLWVTTEDQGFFTQPVSTMGDPDSVSYCANSDLVVWQALSHDGRHMATAGGDGRACLWPSQPPESAQVQPFKTMLHAQSLRWVGFSPDGRLLATQSVTGEVRLWDVPTGLPVGPPLPGNPGTPPCFAEGSLWTAVGHQVRRYRLEPVGLDSARPWLQEFFTAPH